MFYMLAPMRMSIPSVQSLACNRDQSALPVVKPPTFSSPRLRAIRSPFAKSEGNVDLAGNIFGVPETGTEKVFPVRSAIVF